MSARREQRSLGARPAASTGSGLEGPRNGPTGGEEAAVAALRQALRDIRFGSVLIKIHQGEVVGIETSTKVRLRGSETL